MLSEEYIITLLLENEIFEVELFGLDGLFLLDGGFWKSSAFLMSVRIGGLFYFGECR